MTNFLKETINVLEDKGKQTTDVLWVGQINEKGESYKMSWDDFSKQADFLYDAGFGGNEINMQIVVVGKDFWLERHEYDGSEWWEIRTFPVEPTKFGKLKKRGYYGEYEIVSLNDAPAICPICFNNMDSHYDFCPSCHERLDWSE